MKNAVLYIRVSTEEQATTGTSLDTQRDECLAAAQRRGARVVAVCDDAGVSGAKYETRPGLQEALALIEAGGVDLLIVHRLDRLGRSTKITLSIAERVARAGAQIITAVDGQEFGGSATGKMMLSVLASVAELERGLIRERTMAGRRARALEGKQPARSRPAYGYRIVTQNDVLRGVTGEVPGTYLIDEPAASHVRMMYQRFAQGDTLRQIGKRLDADGIPPPMGESKRGKMAWRATVIHRILQNPAYKGTAVSQRFEAKHDEQRVVTGEKKTDTYYVERPESEWVFIPCPPRVSEELWQTAQERSAQNRILFGGRSDRRYPLSALAYCPRCGCRMVGERKTDKGRTYRYYRCHTDRCGRAVTFPAPRLEKDVRDTLLWAAEQTELIADTITMYQDFRDGERESDGAEAKIHRLEREREELAQRARATAKAQVNALLAGAQEDDFAELFNEISERRAAIEGELAALGRQRAIQRKPAEEPQTTAEKLAAAIRAIEGALDAGDDVFSPAEKQSLLSRIIHRVTPEGDRVKVAFKTESVAMGQSVICPDSVA